MSSSKSSSESTENDTKLSSSSQTKKKQVVFELEQMDTNISSTTQSSQNKLISNILEIKDSPIVQEYKEKKPVTKTNISFYEKKTPVSSSEKKTTPTGTRRKVALKYQNLERRGSSRIYKIEQQEKQRLKEEEDRKLKFSQGYYNISSDSYPELNFSFNFSDEQNPPVPEKRKRKKKSISTLPIDSPNEKKRPIVKKKRKKNEVIDLLSSSEQDSISTKKTSGDLNRNNSFSGSSIGQDNVHSLTNISLQLNDPKQQHDEQVQNEEDNPNIGNTSSVKDSPMHACAKATTPFDHTDDISLPKISKQKGISYPHTGTANSPVLRRRIEKETSFSQHQELTDDQPDENYFSIPTSIGIPSHIDHNQGKDVADSRIQPSPVRNDIVPNTIPLGLVHKGSQKSCTSAGNLKNDNSSSDESQKHPVDTSNIIYHTAAVLYKKRNIPGRKKKKSKPALGDVFKYYYTQKNNTLPELPDVKPQYEADDHGRLMGLINKQYTIQEVYSNVENEDILTSFERPFVINAIHLFTINYLYIAEQFPGNGYRICKRIRELWNETDDKEKDEFVNSTKLRNEKYPADWPLEIYHLMQPVFSHPTIQALELEDPILGCIAQVIFGLPKFKHTLKRKAPEVVPHFLSDENIKLSLSLDHIYGDGTLRPTLGDHDDSTQFDKRTPAEVLQDVTSNYEESLQQFREDRRKELSSPKNLILDDDIEMVPKHLHKLNSGVACMFNIILTAALVDCWKSTNGFNRKFTVQCQPGELYFGNKHNQSIGYMGYNFVKNKLKEFDIAIDIVDREYLDCVTNNIWRVRRKCPYIIVQGILRTVKKDEKQKRTKRKPLRKDKTTSTKETPYVKQRSNDDPEHNEHLILIDTDTGVYYDHLLRNRNGVLIMNDFKLLHLTDPQRSYFKEITMIVAVHLPQLNKQRQKRHELNYFFDTSKYPIGDNPNKAATAYVIDKMNLQKITSNPLKWHPDGDTKIKDYITINHLMWCMQEAKKRRITSTPNIYCSWTSKENDSYKLEGIFDGLEEYVKQFIFRSIPLDVITPPTLETKGKIKRSVHIKAQKHELMDRLGKSLYLDNLISTSNNIPIRLNLTSQKQPRRRTYSVIMPDKNDPTIPNTLCLAKTRDIGLNEKEQPSNPMTNIKFEFMHYVWEACTPHLSLPSRTIPPTHGQELMYYGVFPATMGWHKDHLAEDNRGILKGSNTIIVSFFDTMLFVIKDDVTGIQEEIELNHLDVLILGPHTDKSSKHMVKFKPSKKGNKNTNEKDKVEQCRLAITYRWATDRALFHYDVVDREGFPYNYAIGEASPSF